MRDTAVVLLCKLLPLAASPAPPLSSCNSPTFSQFSYRRYFPPNTLRLLSFMVLDAHSQAVHEGVARPRPQAPFIDSQCGTEKGRKNELQNALRIG